MKNICKMIGNGMLLGIWFFIMLWIGYLIIKARNSSSSWLPMDTSNPAELYVNNNETLTAAKRNNLISST